MRRATTSSTGLTKSSRAPATATAAAAAAKPSGSSKMAPIALTGAVTRVIPKTMKTAIATPSASAARPGRRLIRRSSQPRERRASFQPAEESRALPLPGATVLAALATLASAIYVPILMTWSSDRYGLIGIALSLQSWLVVMGFVVVTGAVIGAVIADRRPSAVPR